MRDRRLAEAAQQVETLINSMNMRLNALTTDTTTDTAAITAALNQFLTEYAAKASGPSKWQRLVEFMQSTLQVWPTAHLRARSCAACTSCSARGQCVAVVFVCLL